MRNNEVIVREKTSNIISLTSKFCENYLNDEYAQLCKKLIEKLSRKHFVIFIYGKEESWAASIVHAIGTINFVFDKSLNPHITFDLISDHFDVSKSSINTKSKKIRDLTGLHYWCDEFSTKFLKERNPFNDLVMVNGFIVNKKNLTAGYLE